MTQPNGMQKTLETIYRSAEESMRDLMDTRNMYIALYHESTQMIEFALTREDSQQFKDKKFHKSRKLGDRNGLTEWIIRNKKSLLVSENFDAWADAQPDVEVFTGVTKCWLGAPMIYGDRVIGVIGLQNFERDHVFDEQHRALLETIASQAAVAIETARQQQKLKDEQAQRLKLEREQAQLERERARKQAQLAAERKQRLDRLQQISQRMAEASANPGEVMGLVVDAARELSHCDMASIYLYDRVAKQFTRGVRALPDGTIKDVPEKELPGKRGLPARIVRRQQEKFIEDAEHEPEATKFAQQREIQAFAGLPLSVGRLKNKRAQVGLLFVNFNKAHTFSAEQREILQHLANQAAVAIDYAGMRQSAQAAEQLAALGTATATLQHRLGNTINVILPAVMRLRLRAGDDPVNEEILETIERNTQFATEVIRRMQTPLREEEWVQTEFNGLIRDAVQKVMQEKGRFPNALITTNLPDLPDSLPVGEQQGHIAVDVQFANKLPRSQGKGGQLTEVFRVLVENAIKAIYPSDGQVTITSQRTGDTARPAVEILVTDTGKGMDEATRSRLFVQPVPRREFGQGAGLGLWLSNIIVRSHEGNIEVIDTKPGEGATFQVTLPILSGRT